MKHMLFVNPPAVNLDHFHCTASRWQTFFPVTPMSTSVPRGIDFVLQMLAMMGMSPRDSKRSVEFIPFLDTIKSLLPLAEDWSSLQRQLKSELFTKLHKREDLSSPFSPREDNLRSGGLYYSFLAINYAIQMLVKASLHAVA